MKKTYLNSFCARCLTLLVLALLSTNLAWGDTYKKVTSITEGEYLIVYEASSRAFNGLDAANDYVSVTITNGEIADANGAAILEIASMTGGYSIKITNGDKAGNYIYGKSGSNSIQYGTTAVASTITVTDGAAKIENNSTYFCYNATSGNDRFRFYKTSTTGASYIVPALYKKETTPAKTLESIAIKTAPIKTIYNVSEYFDPAGLVITATYEGGTTEDIEYAGNEDKFTFSPSLETALQTSNTSVEITYGDKTCTQNIAVNEVQTYTVVVNNDGHGSATADVTEAFEGRLVTLTASNSVVGYKFSSWTVNGGGVTLSSTTTNPATFTMGNQPVTITANFEQIPLQAIVAHNKTDNKYWALTTTVENNKALAVEVEITDGNVCVSNKVAESISWIISDKTASTATISTMDGKYLDGTGENTNISLSDDEFEWVIDGTNKTWRISSDGRPLFEQSVNSKNTHVFGTYAASNINAKQKSDNINDNTRYSDYATAYPIKITLIETTMTTNGCATFSSDSALDLSKLPSGLTAYKATTVSDNKIKMVPVETAVAANTGLFLKGTANTTYAIPVAASGTSLDGNILKATTGEALAEGDYVYVIASGAFQPLANNTVVSKGKAYIPASAITTEGKLEITFNEPTGIENLKSSTLNPQPSQYNLQGVRVNENYKGIVIMNGKKYINK